MSETLARYEPPERPGGGDERIRVAALRELAPPFRSADLCAHLPELPPERIRRVLHALRREGRLRSFGRGPGTRWERVEQPS